MNVLKGRKVGKRVVNCQLWVLKERLQFCLSETIDMFDDFNALVESCDNSRLDTLCLSDENVHVWVSCLDFWVRLGDEGLQGGSRLREKKSEFLDCGRDGNHIVCRVCCVGRCGFAVVCPSVWRMSGVAIAVVEE